MEITNCKTARTEMPINAASIPKALAVRVLDPLEVLVAKVITATKTAELMAPAMVRKELNSAVP